MRTVFPDPATLVFSLFFCQLEGNIFWNCMQIHDCFSRPMPTDEPFPSFASIWFLAGFHWAYLCVPCRRTHSCPPATDATTNELSHRRRTDSGTVLWYENWSAHARPPASFRSCQITNAFFADLVSVQNQERFKQPISSCRWRHVWYMCTARTTIRSSICETANEENRGRVTRTVTVDCSSP